MLEDVAIALAAAHFDAAYIMAFQHGCQIAPLPAEYC